MKWNIEKKGGGGATYFFARSEGGAAKFFARFEGGPLIFSRKKFDEILRLPPPIFNEQSLTHKSYIINFKLFPYVIFNVYSSTDVCILVSWQSE